MYYFLLATQFPTLIILYSTIIRSLEQAVFHDTIREYGKTNSVVAAEYVVPSYSQRPGHIFREIRLSSRSTGRVG